MSNNLTNNTTNTNTQPPSKNAISPTRAENYPEWYQAVINASDLAENSVVRGCMVIKPWGYAIWEQMQQILDEAFKRTGHVNAYFPLLIPLSYLEKEASHVAGFAKECAIVTHTRLEECDGKLIPTSPLEEPLIIRPTSETIIGECYSRWVQSYRDLPILINQWANVMRWEMRTRLFLRTSEFLWQEGHTVHATSEEAQEETLKMLDVYANFAEQTMAMPVIKGMKTPEERFPGAVETYTIEAMMQDYKALQAGTSHFLGQNFAKASNIKFMNQQGKEEIAWTTSWGSTTRLIGAMIMTHSDDDGLVLPPKLAPTQIIMLPIYKNDDQKNLVLEYCHQLKLLLEEQSYNHKALRVSIDDRQINAGERTWSAIKKGIPIRLEIGPRDIESNAVFMGRRDLSSKKKISIDKNEFIATVTKLLDDIQNHLFDRAYLYRQNNIKLISSRAEFEEYFAATKNSKTNPGFASCFSTTGQEILDIIKPLKVTARCIPLKTLEERGRCIFTGKENAQRIVFAKAY